MLRRMGANVRLMTRMAGTPSVMYGVEIVGMADTALEKVRRAIARAAAPEGTGKNYDLVLLACDADQGTMDPAFDVHVLPIQRWSMA